MTTIKSLEINKVNSVKIEIKIKKIFYYRELNIINVIIYKFLPTSPAFVPENKLKLYA